jgi:thiopeptide-type bacteriocin biosynthesis protein
MEYIWPVAGARAFFIRYADEQGPHLRLRFKGDTDWLNEVVLPALEQHFKPYGHWIDQPYTPEPQRFGGVEALVLAEEHFHISSRVVLDRLQRTPYAYNDAMFDALRLNMMAVLAAGLNRHETQRYFAALSRSWVLNFFASDTSQNELIASVEADFDAAMAPQKTAITDELDALWKALLKEKFDTNQPEWLRWYRGNVLIFKSLGENTEKAMPSLLHLTNNRLGIINQDEAYLMYILGKTL